MRIISGKYKGSKIEGYNIEGTRPTMDRIKESLFASIQGYVKNSTVLDLFAGSGSLGFESISMGSSKVYFVDNNKSIIKVLEKNIARLKIDQAILINSDYKCALKKFKDCNIKFNIIYLDPPYKLNLIAGCILLIKEYDLLEHNGIIICEFEEEQVKTNLFSEIKRKKYGNKHILILKNE